MSLFLFVLVFKYIHSVIFIQHIHPSPFAEVLVPLNKKIKMFHLLIHSISWKTSLECWAENGIQACQTSNALPIQLRPLNELRCTLTELRRTFWATPHTSQLRSTLQYLATPASCLYLLNAYVQLSSCNKLRETYRIILYNSVRRPFNKSFLRFTFLCSM